MARTKSECAKLGSDRSREASARKHKLCVEEYNKNPKICISCGENIPYEKRRNKFCNVGCFVKSSNRRIPHPNRRIDPIVKQARRTAYMKSDHYKNVRRKSQNKRQRDKRMVLLSVFGKSCALCCFGDRITIHEKHGNKHKDFDEMSWVEIDEVISSKKGDFVSLCYKCHKHTHWCMEILGMSWEEIYTRVMQCNIANSVNSSEG